MYSTPSAESCERTLEETLAYWRVWAHGHEDGAWGRRVFAGPWHDLVVRTGLVLELLAHADVGSIAADPTTSLPDEIRPLYGLHGDATFEEGFDEEHNTVTRAFDSDAIDATALLIPDVGFLPFDDERIAGTIAAVRDELESEERFVRCYDGEDGLPGDEGTFTLCSSWLVDVLALSGRLDEARARFETLVEHANPLGLFAEEIDTAGDGGVHRGTSRRRSATWTWSTARSTSDD